VSPTKGEVLKMERKMPDDAVDQREYNVHMPEEGVVYYDSVLDQTITVRDVDSDEEFVTYSVEQDPENMNSEPMQRYLAWLAAGRFVKLGKREDPQGGDANDAQIAEVFAEAYGYDPRDFRPIELARFLLSERLNETLEYE
jgi:hypothetical protein